MTDTEATPRPDDESLRAYPDLEAVNALGSPDVADRRVRDHFSVPLAQGQLAVVDREDAAPGAEAALAPVGTLAQRGAPTEPDWTDWSYPGTTCLRASGRP
jgi:hypothetical protein